MKHKGTYVAQQPEEFAEWVRRVAAIKPTCYLEIGSLNGGTLLMVAPALAPRAKIISIDWGCAENLVDALSELRAMGFDARLLTGDSTSPEMETRLLGELGKDRPQACFIDGDHAYAAVLSDYELCRSAASFRPDGLMIGFHDLATVGHFEGESVRAAWKTITAKWPTSCSSEIVYPLPDPRPPCGSVASGIGVLVLP